MFRDELQLCNRFLATAKLMRGFKDRGAAAWRLCKRLREKPIWHKTLGGPYGVEFLLQQLKKEMCPNAIPDIAQHIDNYLFRFQRSQHMSMGEYITLDAELYGRMCQALARVGLDPESDLLESTDWVKKMYDAYQKERDCCQAVPYNWWTSNTGSRWQRGRSTDAWDSAAADASASATGAWAALAIATAEQDAEGDADESNPDAPSRSEYGDAFIDATSNVEFVPWTGDWRDDPWWSEGVEPWQNRAQIQPLPEVLRGWLLLYRSGLERPERLAIQSSVANNWTRAVVAQALKDQWPDTELNRRDNARGDRDLRPSRRADAVFSIHSDFEEDEEVTLLQTSVASEMERAFAALATSEEEALIEMEPRFKFGDEDEEDAYFDAVETILQIMRDARGLQRRHSEAIGVINDIKGNGGYYRDRQQQQASGGRLRGATSATPFWRWQHPSGGRPAGFSEPPGERPTAQRPPGVPVRRPVALQRDAPKGPCLHCGKDHATKDCPDPKKQHHRPTASFATTVSFMSGETMDGAATADDNLAPGKSYAAAWPVFDAPLTKDGATEAPLVLAALGVGSDDQGLGLVDCGVTDNLPGSTAAEALMHKSRELFGFSAVEVDVTAEKVFQFGDGKIEPCVSAAPAAVTPLGDTGRFKCNMADNESTPVLVSIDGLEHQEATTNFKTGAAVFGALDPNCTVELYEGLGKHLCLDFFDEHPTAGDRQAVLEQRPWWISIEDRTASRCDFFVEAAQVTDGDETTPFFQDSSVNVHDIDALFEDNFDKLNALFKTVVEDKSDSFPCVERIFPLLPFESKK